MGRATMTEPTPACVRGCTHSALTDGGEEFRERNAATMGHLCAGCAKRLHKWIVGIPDLYAILDPRKDAGKDPYAPTRRGKISGSPALVRLDVVALQDRRTNARARFNEPGDENMLGGDVPSLMLSWAECLSDDLDLTGRPDSLASAVALLAGPWYPNLCYRPWVDELYTEVEKIHRTLKGLNHVGGPRPLGTCECGQRLYEPDPQPGREQIIECRNCGHRLDGLALVRLAAAQKMRDAG